MDIKKENESLRKIKEGEYMVLVAKLNKVEAQLRIVTPRYISFKLAKKVYHLVFIGRYGWKVIPIG